MSIVVWRQRENKNSRLSNQVLKWTWISLPGYYMQWAEYINRCVMRVFNSVMNFMEIIDKKKFMVQRPLKTSSTNPWLRWNSKWIYAFHIYRLCVFELWGALHVDTCFIICSMYLFNIDDKTASCVCLPAELVHI